jgi:hypothetical protein
MAGKILSALLIVGLLAIAGIVSAQEDVKTAPSCTYCGMEA